MVISPSSPPGVQRQHPSKRWWRSKAIGGRSRTVLRPAKNEFGLDHNESRSCRHGWHRHVSLVMLAFAMMAAIRHRANPPPPKKRATEPRGKHKSTATPSLIRLVNPGSPPHRHQTSLKSESNPHMSSHGLSGVELTRRSLNARTSQSKTATVVLGSVPITENSDSCRSIRHGRLPDAQSACSG